MGQKREIWSGDVSYEPGRGRTVGPSCRQRRALILERRQQCDASIKVPVCNSAIGTEPGNHKLSINGFTTDDSEVILLSLVFLSSCVVIFWFFAGFIYHWPFHFLQPFFCMCRFGTIDWQQCMVSCSWLSVRCPPNSSLSHSLQQDRVRKVSWKTHWSRQFNERKQRPCMEARDTHTQKIIPSAGDVQLFSGK